MLNDFYNETFTPLTASLTSDSKGGNTKTWTAQTASVFKGRKDLISSNKWIQNQAKVYRAQYSILAPFGISLTREQKLRSATTGIDYDVLEVEPLYNHHTEVTIGEE